MTDKRFDSERVSGKPPLPSLAPPTDEIDAEWGADEIPAPARVPQLAVAAPTPAPAPRASTPPPAPRASTPPPAPRASTPPPAPRASTPPPAPGASAPAPRSSTPPRPASSAPPIAVSSSTAPAADAWRKQTLLGIAPVIPAPEPLVVPASENPLRKQTLLGIAPVVASRSEPAPPPASALEAPSAAPVASEPGDGAPSVSSIATPTAVATDAPTTLDVGMSEPELPLREHPAAAPADPATATRKAEAPRARPAPSQSHADLPALKQRRPAWLVPLGVAAALGLGVVGLRQLDRAPTPTRAELAHPLAAKAPAKLHDATPQSDDEGDDDDNTGNDTPPAPPPTEPEPLKAKSDSAPAPTPAAAAAPAVSAASSAAASTASAANAAAPMVPSPSANAAEAPETPASDALHIKIESDPPGARLFWKGKEVGTTPFVLEFQRGERHAYELGLPGYTTRKVVIDGSKTEISIGLRPDPTARSNTSSRK